MLFSHISDTHLGLAQFGYEEREQDIYDSFNQAIDPHPSGRAIIQMANALKRLKQNSIDSFFILGEHDMSRISATPIPYVYHNLEFSKYIGQGKPVYYKDILLVGFDK
jgi:DNA repair exonuclease SbcCD nuclease subunit